jgi:signal transduction histidine kinase
MAPAGRGHRPSGSTRRRLVDDGPEDAQGPDRRQEVVELARLDAVGAKVASVPREPPVVVASSVTPTFDREHLRIVNDKLADKVLALEASEQRLAAVIDLCRRFTSQLDPVTVLRDVCAAARGVTLAQYAVVGLVNEDRTEVLHVLASGLDQGTIEGIKASMSEESLLDPVLTERRPVRCSHPDGRPERAAPTALPSLGESFLGVPIASATRVYGWIGLQNKLGAPGFTEADEQVAAMIGIQAGIAYENARLVEDLRAHATALRVSEARKAGMIHGALDCIITMDWNGIITEFNPAAEVTFGYARREAVGRPFTDLLGAVDARHRRTLEECLASGQGPLIGRHLELPAPPQGWPRVPGRADDRRHSHGRSPDLHRIRAGHHEPEGGRGVAAAQRPAARGNPAGRGGHPHEERVPGQHVARVADAAQHHHRLLAADARRQGRAHLLRPPRIPRRLLTSAQHLVRLIDDVLDLSKVEAGKMAFRPEPMDLAVTIAGARDYLGPLAAQKQLQVDVHVDPSQTGIVVDPAKFRQVLYNYMSNALKFTPDGGRVTVRARPEDPRRFRVEVEDTGPGIAPGDLGRLFVAFQQLETGPSKAHQGTGLGLALTKRLVEAQGGQVGVTSTVGVGSVFYAVFPRVAG